MKPSRSCRLVSSCAAKRSPFVGKRPSSSGWSSQDGLTRDFISAICLSRDLGILYEIGMRGKANEWGCCSYRMFILSLKP